MEHQNKEHKNRYKVNNRPIASLLIGLTFFSIILLVMMLVTAENSKNAGKTARNTSREDKLAAESTATLNGDSEILAVVVEVKSREQQITLFDIAGGETYILTYTGASNITDKYNQVISIKQIPVGTIVDMGYQKDTGKLIRMQISTKAWEYVGVENLTIDQSEKVMKIGNTKYKYTDDVYIIDGEAFIPVSNLSEQDKLTIHGFEETIYSITVLRGHGTVRLEDYETFLGANLSVGYEVMQQITKDMVMTVREGNFNLTVESGDYSATKNITIYRNQETVVSLGDLGPKAIKMSRIIFDLSPFGADLFIDGELMPYANPIELAYGDHTIEASLGGYTTYQGAFKVEEAGKTIKIDLPEVASGEEAVAVVTSEDIIAQEPGTNDGELPLDDENPTDETTIEEENGEASENEEGSVDAEHFVYVQNPIGASVYLNGVFKGVSPTKLDKIIGTYVITFIEDGYETKSYTIEIPKDGKDMYISFENLLKIE